MTQLDSEVTDPNPFIEAILKAATDECARPFCDRCNGGKFLELLRRIEGHRRVVLREALCAVVPEQLTQLPNWADALQVAVRRVAGHRDAILEAWLARVGRDVRFDDVVLFRVVRQCARESLLRKQWIDALIPIAMRTRDASLTESLVLLLHGDLKRFPESRFLGSGVGCY